jgi:hypothetical protein
MLTLDAIIHIPESVSFSVIGQDAFLLNTRTNKYFALEEVGARLWDLLRNGDQPRDCYQTLLAEYEVDPDELEQDLVELLNMMMENGLVELDQA